MTTLFSKKMILTNLYRVGDPPWRKKKKLKELFEDRLRKKKMLKELFEDRLTRT